jgi:hypothetical protein
MPMTSSQNVTMRCPLFPHAGGKERFCRRGRVCGVSRVIDRVEHLIHSFWNSQLSESIQTFIHWGAVLIGYECPLFGSAQRMRVSVSRDV